MRNLNRSFGWIRPLALLILLFVASKTVTAQQVDEEASNASYLLLYLEYGGAGYLYSINAEYPLLVDNKFTMNGRVGFGVGRRVAESSDRAWSVPVGLIGYFGKGSSHLEIALNVSYRHDYRMDGQLKPSRQVLVGPGVGYRFQRSGFFGAVRWTPLYEFTTLPEGYERFERKFLAGLAAGYSF